MSTIEAEKAAFVRDAQTLANERATAAERASLHRFIAELYAHVPPHDVAARSPSDLCGAALALWRFASRRQNASAKVRVYNPATGRDGWSSPHTIVEIVNDDMPFLVDSVTASVNEGGREVRLAIHPILTVARDQSGSVVGLDPPAGGLRESWIQIEITREPDPSLRKALAARLEAALADVRSAVRDWQPMRRALHRVAEEAVAEPAPLPPGEIAEGVDFMRWLDDDNFTYLGFREYIFPGAAAERHSAPRPPLGILAEATYPAFGGLRDLAALPPDVQEFVRRRELLIIAKTERRATVHRAVHMDAIGIRRFNPAGEVVAVELFIGLFTSLAYHHSPSSIPLLRHKVRRTLERAGLAAQSHDGKALLHTLETFPRDELFQITEDELFDTAIGILNLQERQRIALFVRKDPLERFVSCLVYVPRERYDTRLRQSFAAILAEAYAGTATDFSAHLDESVLAHVQFIIRVTRGAVPPVDVAALEQRLAEAGRSWADRVEEAATAAFGEIPGRARLRRLKPFPLPYQALTEPAQAIADLDRIEAVLAGAPIEASLHPRPNGEGTGLRLYRQGEPAVLSDVLPILENLGLRIIAEEPFRIDSDDGGSVWIHEFTISADAGAVPDPLPAAVRRRFEEALVLVWTGEVENDGFNRLVLAAGLSARQATILRLYCKVLRQAGSNFSQSYMEETLARHAGVARRLVQLFERRFDPARAAVGSQSGASLDQVAEVQGIDHALDRVESLDEDRILRAYLTLILNSVRTNYYQTGPSGEPKPALAVKLASHEIDLLPLPRPLYEIYVYSPRVEGVHMRAGKVARGGIRWSDRKEDFRTEILGLMKAQTVKNAVIVPVGSKGGFVLKRPPLQGTPNYREQLAAEGVECYKILIRSLLDVTDNIVAANGSGNGAGAHTIVPPPLVVRHEGDDPYLVVAADKGTAAFSDTANQIALEYSFWLGDAFASGGSAGYDHKEMGITSRGAWELVKRHFRELGRDIQTSEFTMVGVGDMSGDVFGNALLQSQHTRLLAAFNHLHIFIDPQPDPAASFAERERLFRLPRSSWTDYDPSLISPGGGVFDRGLKAVAISTEMKRLFAIEEDILTPAELIRHLLTAEVDLLFFGGIGTFVKARGESHAEVGDRANDAARIDGERVRATVIGEGANLGMTQRGRVAYALNGGHVDTDAIDNSAGVSMSDHEVNIKILLGGAIAAGALGRQEREPLLLQMTDDVAALVLRDNYLQGEALSVAAARGLAGLDRQTRLIRELERPGERGVRLDRALEFLPDEEALAARAASRRGLTRPELAVLLAYAKMSLDHDLLASGLPDLPELAADLRDYFPGALRERFAAQIAAHPLKREITATVVTNDLINRAGLTFIHDMRARTGREAPDIAKSYRIVREVFALAALWGEIEALDNRVPASLQTEMLLEISGLVEHEAAWLLRGRRLDLGREIARFAPSIRRLGQIVPELLPPTERALLDQRASRFAAAGVPQPLAARAGAVIFLTTALEVGELAERTTQPIDRAARVFYQLGARFALDEMRDAARRLPSETPWQKTAAESLIDDFYGLQAELAVRVLAGAAEFSANGAADPLAGWAQTHAEQIAPADAVASELRTASAPDLAMLVVARQQLRQALG